MQSDGRAGNLYTVRLTGQEVYNVLHLLEEWAVETESYYRLVGCVSIAEKVREQVRAQGWGRDLPKHEVA